MYSLPQQYLSFRLISLYITFPHDSARTSPGIYMKYITHDSRNQNDSKTKFTLKRNLETNGDGSTHQNLQHKLNFTINLETSLLSKFKVLYFLSLPMVSAAPVITNAPNSVGIDILKNATLPCEASGIPPPQTVWRRADGKPLDFQYRFTMLRSGTLFINGTCLGASL